MDEGLLNDLLECSVCLERLDTSSRVLPCQHTFCLKCLKVIVESHKELRCPECRVLVEAKVEELPPNVLLMRILEGMRNQPRKAVAGPRTPRSGHSQGQPQSVQQSCREGKQLPPHARALYDYASKEMGDLSFKKGETILLQKKLDPFWYQGECSGRSGMFPITYVQVIIPLPNPTALCKALYDFRMSAPDEEGCLAFDKGAIISVHRRVDENWAEGRLEQRVGIFPIAFVELNHAARQLMNNVPLNRPVPSLPEQTRPGHSEHRHHAQHTHRYLPMSMSTPASTAGNYQNIATMSQSHPNYHNHPPPQLLQPQVIQPQIQSVQPQVTISTISHGGLLTTTAVPRNIIEPTQTKHSLDLIHFTNNKHPLLPNSDRVRLKFDSYNSTPVHKVDTTYQNVRAEFNQANLNNASSDSSSSMNTPSIGVSSMSTANTSSDTSTSESAEPSLPSSPDNNTERNATVIASTTIQAPEAESNAENPVLNASMGVLSINEGSTATNTSLNVSLPPTESPKNVVTTSQSQENLERLDVPSSSKTRHSGPDSLLNFGLGLQAALSPSHSKDAGYMAARTREHHREKRHSLTPSTHLQGRESTPNRHSAEILATSLLDHGVLERDRTTADRSRTERDRRRRRSRSNELALPATYVALYPYKPQKPDELELRKGGVYLVTERCRDGWYKGSSERSQRAGVFPGNYVTARPHSRKDKPAPPAPSPAAPPPPDAPPRTHSPPAQVPMYQWSQSPLQTATQPTTPRSEKCKDKKAEKSSLSSVMKRLTAMKKCKSPPAAYSMDNPVFDDAPGPSLLLNLPAQHQHVRPTNEGPWQTQHRKSQSLDVTAAKRDKHPAQTVKERFRCIVPYPPNSEYELELKVDDIVLVSKKRGDGWYKGTLQRTGRTGLFPASFVQSCPE